MSRRARVLAALLVLPLLGLWSGPAGAVTTAASCSPTASGFCVDFGSAVMTPGTTTVQTTAAAPADLSLVLANTSATRSSDSSVWWDHLTLSGFTGDAAPHLTPSASLTNGLLLAGAASDCGADSGGSWSSCAAGYGNALIYVTGTGGLMDGVRTGTFGIQRIENVNPVSVEGAVIDYLATISICANTQLGACSLLSTFTAHLVGMPGTGGDPGPLTLTTRSTYDYNTGYGTAHADGSLDSLTLNLRGSSSQTRGGAVAPQTTLTVPRTCGANATGLSVTDRNGDAIPLAVAFPTTSCPTASFTDAETRSGQVTLDGAASSTPVAGRTVTRWHWTFGDGTPPLVTTVASVTHTYTTIAARTVTLQAEDSLGALSAVSAHAIAASTLSVAASPTTVLYGRTSRISGVLRTSGSNAALGGRSIHLLRCDQSYASCATVATTTTSTASSTLGTYAFVVKPSQHTGYRVDFAGGTHLIGSAAKALIKVRVTVGITASATSLRLGSTVTLSGTVGPNRAGQRIVLQRWVDYGWVTVSTHTLSTSSAYAWAIRPTSRGASYYQVVYPGDSTHLGGTSHPVTLQTS